MSQAGASSLAEAAYQELRATAFASLAGSVMALSGSYDSAAPSRLRPDVNRIRGGSADSHLDSYTRGSLSRQCRDLERNSSLARGLVERQVDLVVADGFGLRVKTKDKNWNGACEWLVNRVCGEDEDGTPVPEMLLGMDLSGLPAFDIRGRWCLTDSLSDIVRRWNYEGDTGVNFVSTGSVQFVEGERIVNPSRGADKGINGQAGAMVGGVEMDAYGKAVRFHVATYNAAGNTTMTGTTSVDAANFVLLCNPLRDVTGSTRGEPQLQAALKRLGHLEAMDETVLVAARIQAAIAAVIKLNRPVEDLMNSPGETVTKADGTEERWQESESGIYKRLGIDEEVVFPPPSQPGQQHESYCLLQYLFVAAEMGLPMPVALLRGEGVNLSTIRCLMQVSWKRCERLQKKLKGFCRRVYKFLVAWLIRNGFLPFNPQWEAHEWMAPPPPVMDPMVALQEARGLMDARIKSKKRVAQEIYGINTQTEDEDIEAELKDGANRGILPVAQPGSGPGASGGAGPGGVAGAAAPASADEDANADGADKKSEDDANPVEDGKPAAAKSASKSSKSGKAAADGGYLIGDKTLAGELVRQVSGKDIPGDSAKVILTEMVGMDESQASAIIDPAMGHVPPKPEPEGTP